MITTEYSVAGPAHITIAIVTAQKSCEKSAPKLWSTPGKKIA